MRAVYAVSFTFGSRTNPDDVLNFVGGWIARGRAPEELRTSWEPGRRSYELPEHGHSLEVEVVTSDLGRLWHGAWRHPHADDLRLYVLADVEIGVIEDTVTLYLVLRVGWAQAMVAPPRFEMRAPRLAREAVGRFDLRDGQQQLTAKPAVLDAQSVDEFVDGVLLDPTRTRPVVFCSDDPQRMAPNLDPDPLARELAGLAHVYTSFYGLPGRKVERRLGRLGCRDGGVRIWWPGLRIDDDPNRHPLLTGRALRDWRGPDPGKLIFRRISTAAAMNAAPTSHAELRRAAHLAQAVARGGDASEMLEYALEVNEELEVELRAKEEQLQEIAIELEELKEKLRARDEEIERINRSYGEALTHNRLEASPDADEDEEDHEPSNVHDAVVAAATRCPHLAFADRAYESARESPFKHPNDIYDALLKLDRLAATWARQGGIGGHDLGQGAKQLGLDWKADVSQTARSKHGRHYTYTWNGETRVMGPHVRLGGGSGAGRTARIYLEKFEPENPEERKLIVAHVGRKLPDSTT